MWGSLLCLREAARGGAVEQRGRQRFGLLATGLVSPVYNTRNFGVGELGYAWIGT